MQKDWIKLYRGLKQKAFYKKAEYLQLWIHLLLSVGHGEKEILWNGQSRKLEPGQMITGRDALSRETGINRSKIERILKFFENEQQIEQQKTTKFRLITLKNWSEYQQSEQRFEQQVSNKRATSEQQVSTNNKVKNIKNDKNIYKYIADEKFLKTFTDFLEMRKKKKNPATERAQELLLDKLHGHTIEDAISMLERSIERGWQGVFPLQDNGIKKQRNIVKL